MSSIYLLFGSNIGNRTANINHAIQLLVNRGFKLLHQSPIYETEAWGILSQPTFYNVCAEFKTTYSPVECLDICKKIENQIGRLERGRWQAREIDIDILYFDDIIIRSSKLTIPHTQLIRRIFALVPLNNIAPKKIHPVIQLNTTELLRLCTDEQQIIKIID